MRPFLLTAVVVLLVLSFMPVTICQGCKTQCDAPGPYKRHTAHCAEYSEWINARFARSETKDRQEQEELAAKTLRLDAAPPEEERAQLREALNETFELPHPAPIQPIQLPPSRIGRKRRAPHALRDYIPSSTAGRLSEHVSQLVPPPPSISTPCAESQPAVNDAPVPDSVPDRPRARQVHETEPNDFGIFRRYFTYPDKDTDSGTAADSLCDSPAIVAPSPNAAAAASPAQGFGRAAVTAATTAAQQWFAPFLNATIFRLMHWIYSGSNLKSAAEVDRLVREVILAEDFSAADLDGFSVQREEQRLDADPQRGNRPDGDGWREGILNLRMPKEKTKFKSEDDAPVLEVNGLYYRPLTEVIRAAYEDPSASQFEFTPHELRFCEDAGASEGPQNSERIYTEAYTADAVLEEQERISLLPRNPDDDPDVPYAIAALMFWSDSTHLTNFGTASLWPIYLFFGNLSKYIRCRPTSFAAHHLAYVPSLPDSVQDVYKRIYGSLASTNVLRFLRSELMHAVWLLLLDDEFVKAYRDGMLVTCGDGIRRRIFPRIFTYSADYPERALLACIRFLAQAPCPACLMQKSKIHDMGTKLDMRRRQDFRKDGLHIWQKIEMVRKWIFEWGYSTASVAIERVLGFTSLLPTRNAFSARLAPFGFDHYEMYVVDLLHEFELGVWKAIFTHLLRVLYAVASDKLGEFNVRFRSVPTFGRSTIRRFHVNVSAMKKLAARDFEDILQCIIPCVEGLIESPTLEKIVLDMLWELAVWHALAKLRLHTDTTLKILETVTSRLGAAVRRFATACEDVETYELDKEVSARTRRKAKAQGNKGKPSAGNSKGKGQASQPALATRKRKYLNLKTFKWHSMAHIHHVIRRHGTSESYSTQTGELEHRRVKAFYARTNKINYVKQIALRTHRQRALNSIHTKGAEDAARRRAATATLPQNEAPGAGNLPGPSPSHPADKPAVKKRGRPRKASSLSLSAHEKDPLPATSYTAHHHISDSREHWIDLPTWASTNREDPAVKGFLPLLQDHLISRLTGREYDGDETYTDDERRQVQIRSDRLYRHKVLRVNYTTYDMRRDQDSINPRTHPDIMLPSQDESDHPYWYARVLAIFHADVRYTGPGSKGQEYERVEFLWIRWFGLDFSAPGGFRTRRLHRIGFVPDDDGGAFGFLDPQVVIRAAHLIPAFAHGYTSNLLGPSLARQDDEDDEDFENYYVNMFVDRDMFMRYLGGGIGHKATRKLVSIRDAFAAITGFVLHSESADEAAGQPSDAAEAEEEADRAELTHDLTDIEPDETLGEAEVDDELEVPESEVEDFGYNAADTDDEADETEASSAAIEVDTDVQAQDRGATGTANAQSAIHGRAPRRTRTRVEADTEPWLGPEDGEDGILIESDNEPSL